MNPSVVRLLRRLLPLFAGAAVGPRAEAIVSLPVPNREPNPSEPGLSRSEELQTNKLIFGVARAGQPQLLSHASHSSHSSHSSHASHYSGSSGGGSYTPPAPAPAPVAPPQAPPKQNPPAKPAPKPEEQVPPASEATPEMAQVLKKLPRVRSQWPAEARLTKPTEFSIYDGDQVVGVVRMNAGTRIKVVEITLQHAVVRVGGTQSPLPVGNTNIVEVMGGAAKILALPDDAAKPTETGGKP